MKTLFLKNKPLNKDNLYKEIRKFYTISYSEIVFRFLYCIGYFSFFIILSSIFTPYFSQLIFVSIISLFCFHNLFKNYLISKEFVFNSLAKYSFVFLFLYIFFEHSHLFNFLNKFTPFFFLNLFIYSASFCFLFFFYATKYLFVEDLFKNKNIVIQTINNENYCLSNEDVKDVLTIFETIGLFSNINKTPKNKVEQELLESFLNSLIVEKVNSEIYQEDIKKLIELSNQKSLGSSYKLKLNLAIFIFKISQKQEK